MYVHMFRDFKVVCRIPVNFIFCNELYTVYVLRFNFSFNLVELK